MQNANGRQPERLEEFVAKIAARTGLNPETVADGIRAEVRRGWIRVEGGRVVGLSREARAALAGAFAEVGP
jgi:hypothetical protein